MGVQREAIIRKIYNEQAVESLVRKLKQQSGHTFGLSNLLKPLRTYVKHEDVQLLQDITVNKVKCYTSLLLVLEDLLDGYNVRVTTNVRVYQEVLDTFYNSKLTRQKQREQYEFQVRKNAYEISKHDDHIEAFSLYLNLKDTKAGRIKMDKQPENSCTTQYALTPVNIDKRTRVNGVTLENCTESHLLSAIRQCNELIASYSDIKNSKRIDELVAKANEDIKELTTYLDNL